jgi:glycosyltransferase involved in cell wall biosynthesis
MYGVLLISICVVMYAFGLLLSAINLVGLHSPWIRAVCLASIWYSGMPATLGSLLAALDLFVLLPLKRRRTAVIGRNPSFRKQEQQVTVVLTAYNDEESIADAVADFRAQPQVARIIVVDNNSRDRTAKRAEEAGAVVVIEQCPGYGRCVYRCFLEALEHKSDLILLCEGDLTFRAADIPKFLAYLPHADVVNGTRIVEQLRELSTQLTTFMYYGNFFVGKLLECKHIGQGTFTDVGTTYKLLRREALERLLPLLDPAVNLEFNAHFLDTALMHGLRLVECPITFHSRVGVSKGGNVNNRRALMVGARMILGLIFGWRWFSGN